MESQADGMQIRGRQSGRAYGARCKKLIGFPESGSGLRGRFQPERIGTAMKQKRQATQEIKQILREADG